MHDFEVEGHESRHVKQTMLASNNLATGESSLNFYQHGQTSQPQVIDLVLSGLPADCNQQALKRVSGSKHVISTQIDMDNLKGTCKGSGRMQIRLNQGESLDQVKLNFLRQGFNV